MRFAIGLLLLFVGLASTQGQITVEPEVGMPDASFTITITGTNTNFMQGTTTCVEFTNGNTTYNLTEVEVDNETSLTGTLATPANAPIGDYDVKVYHGPGCDSTEWDCADCFSVIDCNLSAAGVGTDISCQGAADGVATANVAGGVDPVEITWSNNMTGATISQLAAGTYTFIAEDGQGCTVNGSVVISEPAALSVNVDGTTDVSCFDGQDGSIDITVEGGTGAKSFMWDNGAGTNEDPTDLAAGTYQVVVTDENACVADAMATIGAPDSIGLVISATNLTGVASDDGTAAVMATGGDGNYSYLWSNGSMDAAIDQLAPGNYSVTVTDGNGCTATDSVAVSGVDCTLSLTSEQTQILCAGDSTGSIIYIIQGGSDRVRLEVMGQPISLGQGAENLPAGVYEAFAFDSSNACVATLVDTLVEAAAIDIVIDSVKGDADGSSGSIMSTVTGGSGSFTFEWTKDEAVVGVEEDLTDIAAGKYVLRVTDSNGCVAISDTVTVEMTTAILEVSLGNRVRIFPNPTEGLLRVLVADPNLEIGPTIEFYDLSGVLVRQKIVVNHAVDVYDLATGIYLAKITVDQQAYLSKVIRL